MRYFNYFSSYGEICFYKCQDEFCKKLGYKNTLFNLKEKYKIKLDEKKRILCAIEAKQPIEDKKIQ